MGDRLADVLQHIDSSNLESFLLDRRDGDREHHAQAKFGEDPDAAFERAQAAEEEVVEEEEEDADLLDLGEVEASWRASRARDLAQAPMTTSMRQQYATAGHRTGIKGVIEDYKETNPGLQKRIEQHARDSDFMAPIYDTYGQRNAYRHLAEAERRRHLPAFGRVLDLYQAEHYVSLIEKAHPQTPLLFLLYDTTMPETKWLRDHFASLAEKYPLARFVTIRANVADPDMDDIALPAVLVYKDNALVANLIRFQDEVGSRRWTDEDTERVLCAASILNEDLMDDTFVPPRQSHVDV